MHSSKQMRSEGGKKLFGSYGLVLKYKEYKESCARMACMIPTQMQWLTPGETVVVPFFADGFEPGSGCAAFSCLRFV